MQRRIFPILTILSIFCFSAGTSLFGQSRDFQTRAGFEVSMDLTKDLKGSLDVGQRFRDNSLRYDRSLLTGSLSYDLPKGFSTGAGARYQLVMNSDQQLESRYRIHGDLNYRWKVSYFKVKVRDRIQYGFDEITSTVNSGNKLTNRSRVGVVYDIFGTPLSLYTSFEVYLVLNDPVNAAYALNKVVAGASVNLTGRMDLKLYYLLEDEVNKRYPKQAHIIVATLGLKL